MRVYLLTLAALITLSSILPDAQAQKGGEDETGPYLVADNWMKPFARPGYIQGSQGGVFAESPNRIFVLNRGELKLPAKLPDAFNGAGDTLTPTILNLVCFWAVEIPLAYLLAHSFGYGPPGVFAAFPIAFGLMAVLSAMVFRRGQWKTKRV